MRINFKRIEIHNFMAFDDAVFDYDEFKGMNLICGKNFDIPGSKNGVGKSCLSYALTFALFGEIPSKIKNQYIRNRYINSKEVRTTLWFDVGDVSYKVSSGFNKGGLSYCTLSQIEGKDEIDLTKSSIAETRKYLEKEILHCDMQIFLRTIYLTADQNCNFFRLSKGEKKTFVEKLFDIAAFGQMYFNIHRDILSYDKQILSKQSKLMTLNNADAEYKKCIDEYDANKQQKISQLNENIVEMTSRLNALKNQTIAKNSETVSKYEDAINKIVEATNKIKQQTTDLDSKKNKIEVQIHKLTLSSENRQKIIDKHKSIMTKLCDECSAIFKEHYNINSYLKEIEENTAEIAKLNSSVSDCKNRKDALAAKQTTLDKKLKLANEKIDELTKEFNENSRAIAQLEAQIDSANSQLEKENNAVNPYTKLFESNQSEIASENESLNNIEEEYRYLKFAENIVSQDTLRKFIIKDLIGLLNNKIKVYLSKLGAKYSVVFDEDMDYTFITESGECDYDNFSGGERTRIMIATCFAFRDFMAIRNNLSSNILIVDEFIDSALDQLAVDNVIQILCDYCKVYKQNIHLISHRKDIDNSVFDNIIQMQKKNNISKIVVLDRDIKHA